MRNPSRTLQNSIFEPLYSQEELHIQPTQPFSSDWLSDQSSHSSPFSIAPPSSAGIMACTMKRAAASIVFDQNVSGKDSSSGFSAMEFAREDEHKRPTCDDQHAAILGMGSPCGSSGSILMPTSGGPPSRSRSTSDVGNPDDGSVASKLLSSITKSISSPSLLACCKESARETPYQKSLRLRTMKLQHCAEELGSESCGLFGSEISCDGSPYGAGDNPINRIMRSSSQSTREFFAAHEGIDASSKMISVRSSPNLGCFSSVSKHNTSQIKERSFPPPLSHSLPRCASADSFSLRAYREDGRFVLKEVKAPCRQYFQANRKDGRLTLQRLTTDEDFQSKHTSSDDEAHIRECRESEVEDDNIGMYGDIVASDKVEVETDISPANLVGGLEKGRLIKESKKINSVGVDNMDEQNTTEEAAESLLMPTFAPASSKIIKSDFKSAKRKITGKFASSARIRRSSSNRHLLSSSSNQQSPLHLPNLNYGRDFDATKCSQCAVNLGSESKTEAVSLRKSSFGTGNSLSKSFGKSPSSRIIFKDVSAKGLMEIVSKLLASFGLAENGEIYSREIDKNSHKYGGEVMKSIMYKGIKSLNIGVREIEGGSRKPVYSGVLFDVTSYERGFHCRRHTFREGELCVSESSTDTRRAAPLQGTEWLHTLHCKEAFDRNLVKGAFMKLHSCVV